MRANEAAQTAAAERRQAAEAKHAEAREEKIRDLVIEAAEAEIEDVGAMDELCEALEERLDLDDAYCDRARRPLREIVERLCGDLALSPDWRRWEDEGEGWASADPCARPRCSPFNHPSAKPLMAGAGSTFAAHAPSQRLQGGHDLE